jgi:hypothetical protein
MITARTSEEEFLRDIIPDWILFSACRMKRRSVQPNLARRAARVLQKLKNVPGLSIEEKSVHALGLAATPEERWEIFERFVRSAGYWRPLKRSKSGSS